jgi:DNA repair photolyase
MRTSLSLIENKTILTATGGFLGEGFTHTINLSHGCPFAGSLCGLYCYAQHNPWVTRGRPWGLYGYKRHVRTAYCRQYDAHRGRPLRIFMSSSSDPYAPQEVRLRLTQGLLDAMQDRPPDVLLIQTRSPLVARDLPLIGVLARRCELWLSVTVETDRDRIPGFPGHATPIRKRLAALRAFRAAGVPTQAAVSPLLPLADPEAFARELGQACDRVILDHYLLGDGSQGLRTRRTGFPEMLEAAGFGAWNDLDKFWEVKAGFDRVLGPGRVLVSSEGFNSVGRGEPRAGEPRP